MSNCPFCEPSLSDRTIEQNQTAKIFFSNPRLTKGHLLVSPQRHVEEPWQLTEAEITDVFSLIHKYQKLLAEKIGTGCDVKQNYRPFLKQGRLKVNHVHFHLIPRTFEDEIFEKSQQFEAAIFQDLPDGEADSVLELLEGAK